MNEPLPFGAGVLPDGIRSRFARANGLRFHFLEAGFETPARACVLMLHGFPELAFSWRHNMVALAEAGFHVIAPDQRGYGRTTGWESGYDCDLQSFQMMNLVTDMVALTSALGYRRVRAVIGHDFGGPVAAHCAVLRPDIFRSAVLMAAPFRGMPELAIGSEEASQPPEDPVLRQLGDLDPPREHYQWWYTTRGAEDDMLHAPQGLHAFLRAYFHYKSGDWEGNRPFRLAEWSAKELAKMPTYYVMERGKGMAANVAPYMPSAEQIAACRWLTDDDLKVYTDEFTRTGLQGSLNSYRCDSGGFNLRAMRLFARRTLDVPSLFISGEHDWGVYQRPGWIENMADKVCTDFRGCHLVKRAGHWVQQEQPAATNELILSFIA